MALIDLEKSRELRNLIESLTHSGCKQLNKEELKIVLDTYSDKVYMNLLHEEIMKMLKKEHSEVRYSAVQVINEFFLKFEEFRNFILRELHEVLKLTLALKSPKELPPPKAAAKELKKLTLSYLLAWEKRFHLTKIQRAIKYLEKFEHVDFRTFEIVDPAKRREKEEWELRMSKLNKERLKKINQEVEDMMAEMGETLTSLESCFELLMPPLGDHLEPGCSPTESSELTPSQGDLRLFGILNSKHSVQIEIGSSIVINVDDENSAVVDAAKDAFSLINNRFLPKIKAWLEIINKANGGDDLRRKATKLRDNLEVMVSKYNRLEFVRERHQKSGEVAAEEEEDLVSSDSDLEEVPELKPTPKERANEERSFLSETLDGPSREKKKKKMKSEVEKKAKEGGREESGDAGPSGIGAVREKGAGESSRSSRKAKLLEQAPRLPFDIDLYHWEDEKLPVPTMIAVNSEGARFWGGGLSSDELTELPVPEGSASLRTRVIEFAGKWEPVSHQCRTPLPTGKLCPRQDRLKCPFHGLIVPRDESGKIIKKEDEERVAKSKTKPEVPDWQDPKLLAEIKAQTGIDLKMPEKGKRTRKKKYAGLTDLKELKNTAEIRLSKKIFNKKSLKRVAETLDKIDHKKHRDKFGDQFNYVHGT